MSLRFTKNFGNILSFAYGGKVDLGAQYDVLRGPAEWLATQTIDSGVTVDNTVPDEEDGFNFVRTIDGNYLPLIHTSSDYPEGWDGAASLVPSAMIPFNVASAGETYLDYPISNVADYAIYGIMFGDGALTISDAFGAYNIDNPIDCSPILPVTADIKTFAPINQIHYDAETDKYSQQIKWNIYNHGSNDFTFSEVGIFTTLCGSGDRWLVSNVNKNSQGVWRATGAVRTHRPVCMIAYEAFDNTITLHSGDILQIVLTQGAAGLDWTIRPNTGDAGVEGTVAPPPEKQTVTPTQQEIQTETSDISDTTAKAVVELAETYIGNAVYTQALSGTPNRNGAGNGYDCSSFCFYMWQRNGVVCSDSWQSGQNAPNTEALGKWAIKNNKLVSKSQIQVGDIILTARKNSDGTWKYPDKWNHVNHAKLYVGDRVRPDGCRYNVIEMVGTSHDAIRSYYNLDDAIFACAFIIHP